MFAVIVLLPFPQQPKQTLCSCVSFSDGATLQANGTHKNQMGQAEGMYTHTHSLTLSPWLFFCAVTLFFSSEPPKL